MHFDSITISRQSPPATRNPTDLTSDHFMSQEETGHASQRKIAGHSRLDYDDDDSRNI
jgi:hypothetical protein